MNGYQVAFLLGAACLTYVVLTFLDVWFQRKEPTSYREKFSEALGNCWTAIQGTVLGCSIIGGIMLALWGIYWALEVLGDMT